MTRLIHELPHTTFAWCPTTPILATASETNDHHFQLDLFHLTTDINGTRQVPLGKAPTSSRVSTLAWGSYQATHTWGLLAAGTDHGGLELWDPWAMADTEKSPGRSALLHETSTHSRRILHMDFNSHQTNLLATAGNDNDVAIWDLSHGLERPYKAGFQTDSAMDSVTHLTWNSHVSHILGLARSSGRTAVLDLRARRQAFTLQGDHPIAAMAWNPDNATQLVTASSDDNYPHLMLWDLRHAQRPEKVLQSHTRSITDVSWCRQDSDVLVSSSKDGRIVSWHPRQGTATDIACTQEYALQVDFCPRNPNWLASWHLGEIFIWTIAHDHALGDDRDLAATPAPQDAIMPAATPALTKPPPKWLRRPVGASFGFGGKLVVFTHQRPSSDPRQAPHPPAATNSTGNPRVTLSTVQDAALAKRIRHLETTRVDRRALNGLINERCEQQPSSYDWAVLRCLFAASPRKALIEFLSSFDLTPLSRENTKSTLFNESRPLRQQGTMPSNAPLSGGGGGDNVLSPPMSPMHPENALDAPPPAIGAINRVDATPSPATSTLSGIFRSAAGQLDQHGQRSPLDDLFSTNDAPLPPQHAFGQRWMLPPERQQQQQQHPQQQHQQPQQHHLAASTYPLIDTGNDEDDDENARGGKKGELTAPSRSLLLDRQISQAVAVGNLDLAVSLCLQDNERMADALLLAVSAGQEVFAKTRRAYLEKRAHVPSMQLLDSIVRQDLTSHVQNCHVDDWRSVLAVLCTYAPPTHFSPLCDLLGQRLETAARAYHETTTPLDANEDDPQQWLRQARVCYMVAGNVDRVLALWIADDEIGYKNASFDTMADREKHDLALVALMEMVVVLLIAFENKATSSSASNTMTMPVPVGNDLLFAKYEAYTRLLAREGHMDLAFQYVERITTPSKDVQWLRHRIYCAMETNAALIQPTRPVYPFDSASEITRAPATAITSSPMPSISTVSPIDPSQGATAYHHQHAHPHHQHEPFMTTIHPPTQLPTPLPDGFQPPYVQHPPPPPPAMQARRYHRLSRQISTDMFGAGGFLQAAATAQHQQHQQQHQQHQQGRDTLHFDPIQHQLPSLYQEDFFFDSLSPSEQPTLLPIHAPPPPHMDPALAYRLSRLDGSVYHDSEDMEYFADADDDDQDIDTLDYASPAENPPFDASPPRPTPHAPSAMHQAFGKLTISPEQQQQQQQQHRINRAPSKVYLQHPSQDHKTPQFSVETSPPRPQYHHHQQMAAHEASPTADTQHKASPQREQGPARFSPQQERSPARMGNEDRSRIRPDLLTIYHVLSQALPLSRHFIEPSQRKQWDDTAKKLSELFDALNARTVSEDVAQYLLQLAQALASARYDRALDLHMSLVTTKYQECGSWLLAVKRVIEYKRDLAQSFTP